MKKADLIISVTGGANLILKDQLKESFCKGLVKAATATSNHNDMKCWKRWNLVFILLK